MALKLHQREQANETVYTYTCANNGTILRDQQHSVNTSPGNRNLENPGNNHTLSNAVGGTSGANIEYARRNTNGFSKIYFDSGNLFKSSYFFATNKVTNASVTFGNDWNLDFISSQIVQILSVVSFPIFAAVVEVETGYVLGTSSLANLFDPQTGVIFPIQKIADPFFADFSAFVNSTFLFGNVNDLPAQLSTIQVYIDTYYPGFQIWFIDRQISGANWKLGLNSLQVLNHHLLFIVYMNTDLVETELNSISKTTGYIILGIILAFITVGIAFAALVAFQLNVVSGQILLLKDLKFKEVLGSNAEIKSRSFIYELSELQKCFYNMVITFSGALKGNSNAGQKKTTGAGTSVAGGTSTVAPRAGTGMQNNASTPRLMGAPK
ncbi:hypothetical protein HDU98_002844 [Podochytrium sp. JEL0797]|nr:hypothetical protein HDU98_002844 [Podochytrium sp. JEL0797]